MTIYRHHFCMVDEVISLIEKYYNAPKNFEKLKQYAKSEIENEMVDRLVMMMNEVGEMFKEKYEKDAYLFALLQKDDDVTLSSLLCFAYCDYEEETFEKQLHSMCDNVRTYPRSFLEVLLSVHEEMKSLNHDDIQLLEKLDNMPYEDSIKWNIWKLHTNVESYVKHLCQIIQSLYPVVLKYIDVYEYYEKKYEEEIAALYEENDLFSYLCTKFDLHVEAEEVYVYPSVGKILSITFIDSKPEQIILRYGVGMINNLVEIQRITKEDMLNGLKMLADSSKFEILQLLGKETSYGAQLAEKLHLSTPTISYHMQSLISARFVVFDKKQNRLYYRMNKEYIKYFLQQVEEQLNI